MMDREAWDKAAALHGHVCPGIVVGSRASMLVLELLGRPGQHIGTSYYAIVENDVCGVDGVQMITGCTLGNDSLIIDNQGKFAFSWVDKMSGEGYRLLLKVPVWKSNEPLVLHEKVKFGTATPEEKQKFFAMRQERGQELLEMSDQDLFQIEKITRKIAGKPRLFPFVNCARCGEAFMEAYGTTMDEGIVCAGCRRGQG
ncbi:MAG: FmdE family protein [Syntrophomonadaceae bacterium]